VAAFVIHSKRFQLSTQDWRLVLVENAGSLAKLFMRANTPTDFGQGAMLMIEIRGF
jgi:hypothetical protein